MTFSNSNFPDKEGFYGEYGGKFVDIIDLTLASCNFFTGPICEIVTLHAL